MRVERLENIAEIIAGQSPPSSTYNQNNDGLPFFQGNADFGDMFPIARYWCTTPVKIALPNDILMTVRAPVGPVNICNIESCIGRGLSAIRVNNNHFYKYVYYFLKSHEKHIAKLGVGSTFKAITQKDIKSLQIPLPEKFEDQIRIANILSKAEALIKQRKESIDLLDEFLKSTFFDMFGDIRLNNKKFLKTTLGEKLELITYGLTIRPKYETKGIPLISAKELRSGELDFKNAPKINVYDYNKLSDKAKPKKNEILFSKTGSIGHSALIKSDIVFAISQNAARLVFNKDINPIYALYYLRSSYIQLLANTTAKGNAVKDLQLGDFKKFSFIVPPSILQEKFAQIVKKTEILKFQYQESLNELVNLFGSLSQRAFKGELDLDKMEIDSTVLNESKIVEKKIIPELNPAMHKFIEQSQKLQKLFEQQAKIAEQTTRFLKPIREMEKLLAPIKNLPNIPEEVLQAQKNYERILASLPKNIKKKEETKIGWEDVSTQYAADLIKEKYTGFHFTTEMLFRFFNEEHLISPNYFSSEELKTNPQLHSVDDLKSIVFSALSDGNPFLKLEQVFYNGEKENFTLNITPEDYELIKERSKDERSGVYFTIVS